MKNIITKSIVLLFVCQIMINANMKSQTVVFKENFDTVSALPAQGWEMINKSNPMGTGEWKQGDYNLGALALNGDSTAYAQVDWTSTDTLGTISDWLLTPTIMLQNYDTVTFFALSYNSYQYPDRLELRMSMMGASDSVGVNDTTVGNFSTLLVSINPDLDTFNFPSVYGVYSGRIDSTWKRYTGVVTGLTGITSCRLGFRYYVTDGGTNGTNSSTVGIDSLLIMRIPFAGIAENKFETEIKLYPNPAKDNITLKIMNGDYLVNVYNSIGDNVKSFKTETSKSFDVSGFAKSLYTVQVIDLKTGLSKTIPFVKE
jgi:hypothetical protein